MGETVGYPFAPIPRQVLHKFSDMLPYLSGYAAKFFLYQLNQQYNFKEDDSGHYIVKDGDTCTHGLISRQIGCSKATVGRITKECEERNMLIVREQSTKYGNWYKVVTDVNTWKMGVITGDDGNRLGVITGDDGYGDDVGMLNGDDGKVVGVITGDEGGKEGVAVTEPILKRSKEHANMFIEGGD